MGTEVLLMQVLLLWGIMDVDEVGVGFVVQGAVAVRSMAVFGLAVDVTFKNSVVFHSFAEKEAFLSGLRLMQFRSHRI